MTSKIKSNAWTFVGASSGSDITLPTDFQELLVDLYSMTFNGRAVASITVPKDRITSSPTGDSASAGIAMLYEGGSPHYVVYKKTATKLGVLKISSTAEFAVRVYAR